MVYEARIASSNDDWQHIFGYSKEHAAEKFTEFFNPGCEDVEVVFSRGNKFEEVAIFKMASETKIFYSAEQVSLKKNWGTDNKGGLWHRPQYQLVENRPETTDQ